MLEDRRHEQGHKTQHAVFHCYFPPYTYFKLSPVLSDYIYEHTLINVIGLRKQRDREDAGVTADLVLH